MKYIKDYKDGDRVFDIYLCKHKQSAVTKNGKPYENLILQDKTGTIDAKIWDPNNAGIAEFDSECSGQIPCLLSIRYTQPKSSHPIQKKIPQSF